MPIPQGLGGSKGGKGPKPPSPPQPPAPTPPPSPAEKARRESYAVPMPVAINDRISHFKLNTLTDIPYTAAQTVMSQLPTRLVKGLAAGLPQAIALVNSDTRFAGLPGFLIRAKLAALGITDPTYRTQALDLIDRLGGLPIDQQTALLAIMRGQVQYAPGVAAGPGEPSPVWGGIQAVFPGAAPTQVGVMLPPTGGEELRAVQIIKEFFPGLPVEAIGEPANPLHAVFNSFYSSARDIEAYETHVRDEGPLIASIEFGGAVAPMVIFGGLGMGAGAGARALAAQTMFQTFPAQARLAGEATERIPGIGPPIRDFVGGMLRTAEERINQLLTPIAEAATTAEGIHPDDPHRDDAVNAQANILALLVLHELGTVARSVKLARTVPEDLAAARLGIDEASFMRLGDIGGIRDAARYVGRGITFIDNAASRIALRYLGQSPDEWATSRAARAEARTIGKIQDRYRGDSAAASTAIMERYGSVIPVELAKILGKTSPELIPQAFADWMKAAGGPDAVKGLLRERVQVRQAREEAQAAETLDSAEIARLELKEADLNRAIPLAAGHVPLYEFPHARVMRAALYEPTTRLERFVRGLYDITGTRGMAFRFINELPRNPILYNQFRGERPVNWRELDVDTMTRAFRDAHMPTEQIRRLINEKFALKNDAELYDWLRDVYDTIDASLPLSTPRELRLEITRIWDRPVEGRYRSVFTEDVTDAQGITRRVSRDVIPHEVEPGVFTGRPSQAAEMVNHIELPDPDLLFDAHSVMRRGVRAVERTGIAGKFAVDTFYRLPKYFLQMSTSMLKGPILALRLPAMIERIQFEQMLRTSQFGYKPLLISPQGIQLLESGYMTMPGGVMVPTYAVKAFADEAGGLGLVSPDARYARFQPPQDASLGLIHEALFEPSTTRMYFETKTTDFERGVREPGLEDFEGWRSTITMLAEDPFTRNFAKLELDPDVMYRWLNERDADGNFLNSSVRDVIYDQIAPMLEEPYFKGDVEARVQAFLRDKAESMRQALGNGDSEAIRSVATGKLVTRPTDVSHVRQHFAEDTIFEEYQAKAAELKAVKRVLLEQGHGGDPRVQADWKLSPEQRKAYQGERLRLMREMQAMEADAGISLDDLTGDKGWVRITDESAFRSALREKWSSGEWQMPETLVVERTLRAGRPPESFRGTAKEWIRRARTLESYNRLWYSMFKAATWSDVHLTRGSLYYQIAEETYRALKAKGYTAVDATAFAEARASAVTRDLMYDLSARTTYQRALKDVFWFAPAYQEIVSVWLGKIPAQYYWPVGMALLAGKGAAMYGLLQEAGIIQKDSTGTDVIALPGFGDFVERVTGKKVPDFAYIKATGLNLVTSSFGPSMSYLPSLALAKATRAWGGPFKWLSDKIMQYGLDVTMTPRPIIYAFEAMGAPKAWLGTLESLSPDVIYRTYDRAYDQSMQYAVAGLIDKGIKPPIPEDFFDTTSPVTGGRTLSPAAEDKYKAAQDAYLKQVFNETDSYFHGIAFAKLLGSTVTPGSVNISSREREEWFKFWNTVFPPDAEGNARMTEQQRTRIESYLGDHPNAVAFYTWYTTYGKANRELPYESTGDQEYYDMYYTGERRVRTPEEMGRLIAWNQTRRLYYSELSGELQAISPTLSVPELLRNGYQRAQALNAYHESYDRYLALNPQLTADMEKDRSATAEHYGYPIESYEAGRLATTLRYFNELAPMFTGDEGMRSEEYRAVRAELAQAYSENGEFGPVSTTAEKQMAWFYDNVMDPYFRRTEPLFAKATAAAEQGQDAGKFWDKIRQINNWYASKAIVGPDGTRYPTPEEVFYGNRTPAEQQTALNSWATKPLTWLSDFQREQLGYKTFKGEDKFLAGITKIEDDFYAWIDKHDISYSSLDYDAGLKRRDNMMTNLAQSYGPQAVEVLRLNQAPPYARLAEIGFGKGNDLWNKTVITAQSAARSIEGKGYSLRGYSQEALRWKTWLYGIITAKRAENPAYDRLWDELSVALPETGMEHREGSSLYEAVLFGNFNTQWMPDELVKAGALPLPSGG